MALMPTQVLFPNGSEDDNLIADIDWATGIVRMHMTLPEWHRLVEADRTIRSAERRHLRLRGGIAMRPVWR